jgi:hypothetical protein
MSQNEADQRLFEAMHALIGTGELQSRLTFAALALVRLRDDDLPDHLAKQRRELVAELTSEPLSDETGYQPRPLADGAAEKLAEAILSLYHDFIVGT